MAVSPPSITALPLAPDPNDRSTFNARAYQWSAALGTFTTEVQSVAENVFSNAAGAEAAATSAAANASIAVAAANGEMWTATTSYATGDVVWSPSNGRVYRRRAPGGVTATDPASDPANWWDFVSLQGRPLSLISTNATAEAGRYYVITAPLTLTLPASPAVGAAVQFTDLSLSNASVINPGAEKIRGVAGPMTVNSKYVSLVLVYSGATNGWV